MDYNVPKFSELTPGEVVGYLRDDNGWLRDQAQQLLVQYSTCMSCHGSTGQGVGGIGAALSGSDWVQEDPEALVRIVLHGFDGGAAERGEKIPNNMPGHKFMSDEELAAILTYIRQSWANNAEPIVPEEVARIRAETNDRRELWSPEELRELLN